MCENSSILRIHSPVSRCTCTRVQKIWWTHSGQRCKNEGQIARGTKTKWPRRIPDFHFNWTQRNIILNARNAPEAPIKRQRRFRFISSYIRLDRPRLSIDYTPWNSTRGDEIREFVRIDIHRLFVSSLLASWRAEVLESSSLNRNKFLLYFLEYSDDFLLCTA